MPISPRLSRQLRQTLGEEAAEDLVNWMHDMDAQRDASGDAVRADLAELRQETHAGLARVREEMQAGFAQVREGMQAGFALVRDEMQAGFARSDAHLAELRQDMQTGFARADAKLAELREETRLDFTRAGEQRAHLEVRFERRFGDLLKWSFVFWVGAIGTIAMLAEVLP